MSLKNHTTKQYSREEALVEQKRGPYIHGYVKGYLYIRIFIGTLLSKRLKAIKIY